MMNSSDFLKGVSVGVVGSCLCYGMYQAYANKSKMLDQPRPVYLDYNATTPIDHAVGDAMIPYFREFWGNPSW